MEFRMLNVSIPTAANRSADAALSVCRDHFQKAMDQLLRQLEWPEPLKAAAYHSVMLGGKRIRPLLVFAGCAMVNEGFLRTESLAWEASVRAALAVELIHCYSLVHDDLPCMDDDDLRRGQPTCHIAFDEATAVLAGDALQSLAFEVLSGETLLSAFSQDSAQESTGEVCAMTVLRQLRSLAKAETAMVAGQVMDVQAETRRVSLEELETMHRHKTGALIRASVEMGLLAGGAVPGQPAYESALRFAEHLGLAFQVQDDVLDVTGTTEMLGKQAGADAHLQKSTYPVLLGLEQAQALAQELNQQAMSALSEFGDEADLLRAIGMLLMDRQS